MDKSKIIKQYVPWLKDTLLTFGILLAAVFTVFGLAHITQEKIDASLIFVLAVFLVARFTRGYFYGIFASVAGVLTVNFLFTYPYFAFNFTLTGYPLTVLTMLLVSTITSALTTQIIEQDKIHLEAEKEKMRANLLQAVSHDLRTPLTSILGTASTLIENNEKITEQERLKLLAGIKEESRWIIKIVENLLTITRIDTQGEKNGETQIIHKNNEMVEELVAESVQKTLKFFPQQQIRVEIPDEIVFVPMDGLLIQQVLINLLENAIIHSESTKPVLLKVSVKYNQVVFQVRDWGKGYSPELRSPGKFAGIGLSVCKTIITAHGSTLSSSNPTDGGALFEFSLVKGDIA